MLPSRKVLSFFILTGSLVVALILIFDREKSETIINSVGDLTKTGDLKIPANPEWQNDLVKIDGSFQIKSNEEIEKTKTVTDTVSESLISNYLALKQNQSLDEKSAQKLIEQTINYVDGQKVEKLSYDFLNIVEDYGNQSIYDYGENLGLILKNAKSRSKTNEALVFKEAIESNNPLKLQELEPVIEAYKDFTEQLIDMPTPKTFAKVHLDLVNSMRDTAIGLMGMRNAIQDPLIGMNGIGLYQNGVLTFAKAIEAIKDFLNQNKVDYKQGTGGYYLLYGI